MKVLMTGFDPFGGEPINPAEDAVKRVSDEINGIQVIKLTIPTVRFKSINLVEETIKKEKPDVVICVGQAGGRFAITPELVAINYDDFRIPDNEGNQCVSEPVHADGAPAYFSKLPVKAIVNHLKENNIPSVMSTTAGTYVCNHVFYGLMYLIDKEFPNIRGGFVHIPYTTSQVIDKRDTAFMSMEEIVKGLELVIEACALYNDDINTIGGDIC